MFTLRFRSYCVAEAARPFFTTAFIESLAALSSSNPAKRAESFSLVMVFSMFSFTSLLLILGGSGAAQAGAYSSPSRIAMLAETPSLSAPASRLGKTSARVRIPPEA